MGDDTNVVNLAAKRLKVKSEGEVGLEPKVAPEVDFEAVARVNKAKADKLAKERQQANKSVLRNYRIKS